MSTLLKVKTFSIDAILNKSDGCDEGEESTRILLGLYSELVRHALILRFLHHQSSTHILGSLLLVVRRHVEWQQ